MTLDTDIQNRLNSAEWDLEISQTVLKRQGRRRRRGWTAGFSSVVVLLALTFNMTTLTTPQYVMASESAIEFEVERSIAAVTDMVLADDENSEILSLAYYDEMAVVF